MSSGKTVTVIGGGIAGLSAAVFLAEKNFKVTIYESSPKPGTRHVPPGSERADGNPAHAYNGGLFPELESR